ncbi:MAG: acyltransferase domain-containing protein, partial [Deltaproteobacteria bacterium]|nr:acyltransferase domain-containing protein [Deltaproteobacteria bacterium]
MQNETSKHKPIAVVGVSALFPGSSSAGGFWGDILAGTDMVKDIPNSHWLIEDYYDKDQSAKDKTYGRRGAFLDDVSFNPLEFGVPPSIVPATDTAQLLALIVAQQVLQDATGGQFATMDKERVSVILGVTSAQELLGDMVSRLQKPIWQKSLREAGIPESKVVEVCERIADHYVPWQESTFPGLLGNVVAGRIANRLDLGGTNCVTDAACASTFSATLMAVNELSLGQSDLVITGGVDTMNDIFMYMCFSKTPALSATGDCRPFSDQADGTILGEGIGMVALKRLEDAERDGDRVYAVLRGIGASSDGRAKSVYAPVPEGQAKALRRAYDAAGYGPGTVELVEGHGTGTKAGDAAEFAGLKLAFGEADREDHQWCSLGSVKSQIGHAKAAAGAAGLFKSVMSLHHKVLPPTIKIDQPNPKLELEKSPFNLNTRPRPWVRSSDHPRRASVSSFGFGGSNYHIAFEEYLGDAPQAYRLRNLPTEMVVVGADTQAELCSKLRAVKVGGDNFLSWFARKSQTDFSHTAKAKVAIVATNNSDLKDKLIQAASLIESTDKTQLQTPTGIYYSLNAQPGEVGFIFPGQGSQYLNMGAELPMQWREAGIAWDQAADVQMGEGKKLHDVVFPISVFNDEDKHAQEETLLSTQWAQPAIGVASLSQLGLLDTLGLKPKHVAGHSFGEITALYAAGSITVEEMIAVARKRGELMNEAASLPGAMIAVAATIETVKAALPKDSKVVVANHNAPEQVVLSGQVASIEKATDVLKAAGLKVRALKVATAFHSEVVEDSVKPFAAFLEGIKLKKNAIPVYACSEASPYPKTAKAMRKVLSEQIIKPVRFVEQIEAMHGAGVRTFVEVGPSRVLTNLTKQILEGKEHTAINMDRKGKHAVTSFHHGLSQLVTAGVELNLEALWTAHELLEDPREVKKAAMELKLNGANYNKPYPPKEGAAGLPLPNPEITPEVVIQEVVQEVVREVPVHVAAPVATEYQEELVMKKEINVENNQPLTHTAPAIVPAVSGSDYAAWMQAFGMIQEQTVNAHSAFQKTMADTHMAFLQSAETTMVGLASIMGGASLPAAQPMIQTQTVIQPAPAVAAPVAAPVYEAPVQAAVAVAPVAQAPVIAAEPMPTPAAAVHTAQAPVVPAPIATPAPVVAAPSTELDLHGLLLSVVAEKTGYPTEMLSMGMDLESDLGIDSIKRVEILSAITENAPNLPDIDPSAMADLKTLGQIVEHMGGSVVASAPASEAPAVVATTTTTATSTDLDLQGLLLSVVAEKTGYPTEMLSMGMDLESDLGIDSIKRVEILSAITEQAPGLPDIDPAAMADLKTLGQIVEYMGGDASTATATEAAPVTATATATAAATTEGVDLTALLLEVVAEKTGYPTEMLSMGMDLESDLGIDSIKRVEILSAITEKVPGLPDIDPAAMADLKTLGQIVGHMQDGADAPILAADAQEAGGSDLGKSQIDRYTLEAIEAPASGLTMHGLHQASHVSIVDDGQGVGTHLQAYLENKGLKVELVREVNTASDVVIFLGGLEDAGFENALGVNLEAFHAARVASAKLGTTGGVFITVQDTGGDFGLSGNSRAWLGGLTGLAKTAALEWQDASVRAIDIERGDRTAEQIGQALGDEIWLGGAELEVGLSKDGQRITLQSGQATVEGGKPSLQAGDVVVASGGARGVTAATLIALAQKIPLKFVLLGRS